MLEGRHRGQADGEGLGRREARRQVDFKVVEGADDLIKGTAGIDYDVKAGKLIKADGEGILFARQGASGTWAGFKCSAAMGSNASFLAENDESKKSAAS